MGKITKVKDINIAKLNNAEYRTFMARYGSLIAGDGGDSESPDEISFDPNDPLGIPAELRTAFDSDFKLLTDAVNQSSASEETAQMSAIEGLLTDLAKEGMPEALAAITLTEVVAALKEKNQQYAALTEQRTNARADLPVESAKKIRLRMDEEYDEMSTYAFAQSVVKPTQVTATFISRLNALIDETNALYNQRIALVKAAAAKKQADSESPSEI